MELRYRGPSTPSAAAPFDTNSVEAHRIHWSTIDRVGLEPVRCQCLTPSSCLKIPVTVYLQNTWRGVLKTAHPRLLRIAHNVKRHVAQSTIPPSRLGK